MPKLIPQAGGPQPDRHVKRRIIIVATVVLILGVGAWLLIAHKSTTNDRTAGLSPANAKAQAIVDSAEKAAQTNYSSGQAIYDKELAKTSETDKSARADLYLDMSNLAGSEYGNDYNKALEYAQKAEAEYPSSRTASTIGSLYELTGNTQEAIKWYKLQLVRTTDADKKEFPDDYAYVQKTIKELEAGQ